MPRTRSWTLWAVVGCAVALQLGIRLCDPPPDVSRPRTAPEHEMQRRLVQKAVDAVVREIGGRLRIDEVEVVPLPAPVLAGYNGRHRRIAVSSRAALDAQGTLALVGHECVHALFDQETLTLPGREVVHRRVAEATAAVLGAMLAGRVWSRRGGDGDELTRTVIEEYRAYCDPRSPTGSRQRIERGIAFWGAEAFEPEWLDEEAAHFPDLADVDRVIGICRAHRDPRVAARAVHRSFFGEYSDNDLLSLRLFGTTLPRSPA